MSHTDQSSKYDIEAYRAKLHNLIFIKKSHLSIAKNKNNVAIITVFFVMQTALTALATTQTFQHF